MIFHPQKVSVCEGWVDKKLCPNEPNEQCDYIGLFLKGLGNKFSCKSSQSQLVDFLGWFEKVTIKETLLWLLFGQLLRENWATFYSTIWSHCERSHQEQNRNWRKFSFLFVSTILSTQEGHSHVRSSFRVLQCGLWGKEMTGLTPQVLLSHSACNSKTF